jgi:hypothetical protein
MSRHFLKLRSASLPCLFLASSALIGLPASVLAQNGAKGAATAAKKAEKLDEIATLKQAKALLEEANHDYQGHRAKAVHAIHEALHELEHHHHAAGTAGAKANPQVQAAKAAAKAAHATAAKNGAGTNGVHENQAASDQQLQSAQQLLAKVQTELSSGKHPHALAHVQTAMKELQTALTVK